MTFNLLYKIIKENNISEDVKLMSNSGWECDATEMNGVYYCAEENTIVFTQTKDIYGLTRYSKDPKWKCLN